MGIDASPGQRLVEDALAEHLGFLADNLHEPATHLIRAGGKRLRPMLAWTAYHSANGKLPDVPKEFGFIMAALEELHTFTLVHDDIMDQSATRRGVPTVHKQFGVELAVLAGDALHAASYDAIQRHHLSHLILPYHVRLCMDLCRGQALDLRGPRDKKEYLECIRLKTARLIQESLRYGCIAAGNPGQAEYARIGIHLGAAFQIRDDVLGLEDFGGKQATDVHLRRKTLPYFVALEVDRGFAAVWARGNDHEVLDAYRDAQARETSMEAANRHAGHAAALLQGLPDSPWRDALTRVTREAVTRTA